MCVLRSRQPGHLRVRAVLCRVAPHGDGIPCDAITAPPVGFDAVIGEIIQPGTHDALVTADGFCYTLCLSAILNAEHTQYLQGAEKHLAASLLPRLLIYFGVFSSSSSRSVIFRRLMPSVDPLCSSAEVVGGSTPATPSTISVRLKPTMNR